MNLKEIFTKKIVGLFVLLVIVAGLLVLKNYSNNDLVKKSGEQSYKNTSYIIEGVSVLLTNGVSELEGEPGSASKTTTRYFGNDAFGDLNGDGTEDVVFLLTQSGGGSGTFYYVVAALKTGAEYQGTNAVFLGDRIAPQTTEIHGKEIVVNYADRKPNEPMTARPSMGVSKYLKVSGNALIEARK
jgi:hypothetical protein